MKTIVFYPPANNVRGPAFLEPLLSSLVSGSRKHFISLGIRSTNGKTEFLVRVPDSLVRKVADQLKDAYPGSSTTVANENESQSKKWVCPIRLSPDCISLKTHVDFMEMHSRDLTEPLDGLLESISTGKSGSTGAVCWIHFRLAKTTRVDRAERNASAVASQFRPQLMRRLMMYHASSSAFHSRALVWIASLFKQNTSEASVRSEKLDGLLAEAAIYLEVWAKQNGKALAAQKQTDVANSLSVFLKDGQQIASSRLGSSRNPKHSEVFLITPSELATLWHPPVQSGSVPRIAKSAFKELEPPQNLPSKDKDPNVVTLGRIKYRSDRRLFGMDLDARRRHLYIIGKTGMGKTTLLQNIIVDDIHSERGVAVFDPHGDLATNTLNYIPKRRTNDVVWVDSSDKEYAISFNPLQVHDGFDKSLVADGVLSAFQKVFGFDESQAPRMIHIFRNCLLTLVEQPESCLLDVNRLLIDSGYRKSAIGRVSNHVVREFWIGEFGKWKESDRSAFIASLQNKLGAFTTNERLQRIFEKRKGKINLRRIMDEKKILIVNLSKGSIGENASNLLGTLLLTCLQQAAMSRANIPERNRRDYSIIIDEFQNYATPSIAVFLSEARKYRSHLILSHQYTSQLPKEILDAILGNCGSMLTFQISVDDAELFAKQFGESIVSLSDLVNIPKFHAYCRLLLEGMPSPPYSIETIRSANKPAKSRANACRKVSNERWGANREYR